MASGLRQAGGFLLSGAIATATDALVLTVFTRAFAFDPYTSRLVAIATAMIAGYFAHRHFTFAVTEPASLKQFAAFASVAITAAVLNFAVYAGLLMSWPSLSPLAAMLIATAAAMTLSYVGYRFGVFKKPIP